MGIQIPLMGISETSHKIQILKSGMPGKGIWKKKFKKSLGVGVVITWELFSEDTQDGLYAQRVDPWQRKLKEWQKVDGSQWKGRLDNLYSLNQWGPEWEAGRQIQIYQIAFDSKWQNATQVT